MLCSLPNPRLRLPVCLLTTDQHYGGPWTEKGTFPLLLPLKWLGLFKNKNSAFGKTKQQNNKKERMKDAVLGTRSDQPRIPSQRVWKNGSVYKLGNLGQGEVQTKSTHPSAPSPPPPSSLSSVINGQ